MRKLTMDELGRLSESEFKNSKKTPVCLVLDNIRSLNNVGSVFRTADAFLIDKIYLCGITGTPPHRDIEKTALGATRTVDWVHVESTAECLQILKKEGFTIAGLEQTDSGISLEKFTPPENQKMAYIFGNEVFGVSEEAIALCDTILEIPQFGSKHSFNVSVTAGIVLWHHFLKTCVDQLPAEQ